MSIIDSDDFQRIYCITTYTFKGNIAIYMDLNLAFVTKNNFCHELAVKECFEFSRAQSARLLVNGILLIFCRSYLLGELSEDGPSAQSGEK